MITNVEIEDFIGIFDTDVDCSMFVDYHKYMQETGASFERRDDHRTDSVIAVSYFLNLAYSVAPQLAKAYNETIGTSLGIYESEFNGLKELSLQQHYINIQKTLPGEGYHTWHCENTSRGNTRRILATTLYLNDDFEGGETEFLYQSRRIKPKTGRVVIWPAGWTHRHRGNPPLTGEKYIATSWLEITDVK